ncbi:hypothetical protein LPJ78_003252 [Coemansia sp. RSA 989]|nr:HAD-like domain-containing protein [Coemansia mojavensis]KAJ1741758.1 hypothetical protein LPJ68_002554 [Coemansia sp. RSA 1086]KAJ1748027.1 hypothetical protein LPJ79_004837 [Coemansia sp. RSA 1821]KAJ1864597.1 hypothetical protein LPJ78_003252 [Coemansia sp. RSA 989]KAJ1872047.1 hypothetical protein LPJ55_003420 [Coemansia sp. RSA 990]
MESARIRAVIFDIGGVVVQSPFLAISAYEREHGLPANYINVALSKHGDSGAFQRFERGEIGYEEFEDQWTDELNDTEANNREFLKYLQRHSLDMRMVLPKKTRLNGRVLFARMMQAAQTPNPSVIELIRLLRRRGYRIAALTNNFQNDASAAQEIVQLFDAFVESCKVGWRKPDPRFYMHACNLLQVSPQECLFLDDIPKNLRAAQRLGMSVVQVKIGREPDAVRQVEKILKSRGRFEPKI